MFHGSIVALVTPMFADGVIDEEAVSRLVKWHIESGTDAIVVAGSTGESALLTIPEKQKLFHFVVKEVANRIPVIASTGLSSTQATIELSQIAMAQGVDGLLIMAPAIVKPTQEGLYWHYKNIAEAVALPIILYNVPARTICDVLPETVERLASISNLVAIKESSGKIERVGELMQRCGDRVSVLSGEDNLACDSILQGAKGVISVTANVAPKQMKIMCDVARKGNAVEAKSLDESLQPLHHAAFLEANPIPVKWMLAQMDMIPSGIRLPLTPLSKIHHEKAKQAMQQAQIISREV